MFMHTFTSLLLYSTNSDVGLRLEAAVTMPVFGVQTIQAGLRTFP